MATSVAMFPGHTHCDRQAHPSAGESGKQRPEMPRPHEPCPRCRVSKSEHSRKRHSQLQLPPLRVVGPRPGPGAPRTPRPASSFLGPRLPAGSWQKHTFPVPDLRCPRCPPPRWSMSCPHLLQAPGDLVPGEPTPAERDQPLASPGNFLGHTLSGPASQSPSSEQWGGLDWVQAGTAASPRWGELLAPCSPCCPDRTGNPWTGPANQSLSSP